MIIDTDPMPVEVDLTGIYFKFKEKYRNVFITQLGQQSFVYRALGRAEYRKILENEDFNDFEKEELICDVCLLWPEIFDWDSCDAGIPSELMANILKNSYLDNSTSRKAILDHYRSEMFDLDNQITCIINEAFPQFDIETIDEWDVEKTTKYLSRAEWKLHNFRGLEFIEPQGEFLNEEEQQQEIQTEELVHEQPRKEVDSKPTIRGGSRKNKLTPEKLAELKAKMPEIDWDNDLGTMGEDGLAQDTVDIVAPALRPGF